MEQLKFTAYTDKKYGSEIGSHTVLMDPDTLKFGREIIYREDRQLGAIGGNSRFERYKPEFLTFKFTVDCTGIVEGTKEKDSVYNKIQEMEKLLYVYNSDGHSPSYVLVQYVELLFKGRVKKMNVEYTLFSNSGIPLRATVELTFSGFRCSEEERKKFSKHSPDMSRLITVKEGETLPFLCHRIYGDSLLVRQVARFNNLNSFRNIPAGTELLFPPLKKN
ncbi:MAG: hypothetical protein RR365_12475 [Bacteroides sp.]